MTTTSKLLLGCALSGLLAVTACGAARSGHGDDTVAGSPAAGTANGSSANGSSANGFTATAAMLSGSGRAVEVNASGAARVTGNAGASWSTLRLPARPASGNSISVVGSRVEAVTVDPGGMKLQQSSDGGRTWQARPVPLSVSTDQAELAVSPDGSRLAVLATVRGTANDGDTPQLFVRTSTGALAARQAPAGGALAWSGSRLLLTGGPLRSRLYASADSGASWAAVPVGGPVAPRFGVDPNTPSIGTPLSRADGTLTVPVLLHSGASATVQLYSGPVAALVPGSRVPLSGQVGPGVLAVAATAGADELVIAEPGSTTLHLVTADGQQTVHPTGLPGPVDALSFSDAEHGVAQVTVRSCAGKQDCAETPQVLATSDGGRSWQRTG